MCSQLGAYECHKGSCTPGVAYMYTYSAAHEQLDSPRCRMRVLEHACAHARTHARDLRAVDTLASYPSPPLSFGVGEA